ncbi:MAG: ABC transporter ATP-binding protein [Calditrichaeota bacterium]|nr:MAG: ABC transporter ATP-binding protein [Calditrichota bacterium]
MNPAIRKFLTYARPYRWWIAGATLCGLLKYNIPVLFPWILKDVINALLYTDKINVSEIHIKMLALILIYLFWAVITFYRSYLADQAGQRMIFDLRHDLFVHLQRMSLGFYEKRQVGSIASRLLGDINVAQNFVGAAFTNTIMDLSSLLLISILLFKMNWHLAMVALAIFPLYVILNKRFKKRIRATSKLAQQKMEEIAGDVHEKLGGMSIIQSYTLEKTAEQQFVRENHQYLLYRIANIKNNALAASIIGFLTSIAPVLVVWYGAMQVIHKNLTVGELAAFYAYLGMFYQPLNRLTDLNILLANSQAAIERIFEVFNTSPEIADRPEAREIKIERGEIEFKNISFGYVPEWKVLKNISLTIPAQSVVALVGRSGAGKSTLVKLISRFYDVQDGVIIIDGVDIQDFKIKSLRRQIAMVPQEPILFSGTIYDNITMGKPGARMEEVEEAARLANALNFIKRLPQGFHTQIGEGGVALSGGQRQRIALARAFLKNAPILILDEATSSLDYESEQLIQEALRRLMWGRTTLIIAHRLSTITSADLIVVLEDGRIVEIGKHQDLMTNSHGIYRRLWQAMSTSEAFTMFA